MNASQRIQPPPSPSPPSSTPKRCFVEYGRLLDSSSNNEHSLVALTLSSWRARRSWIRKNLTNYRAYCRIMVDPIEIKTHIMIEHCTIPHDMVWYRYANAGPGLKKAANSLSDLSKGWHWMMPLVYLRNTCLCHLATILPPTAPIVSPSYLQ